MKVSFWQMLKWTVVVWVFCNILWVEIAWIIIQDSLLQLEHLLRLMLLASLFPGKAVGMLFLPQKSTTLSYSLGPKPSLDLFSLKTFNEVVKSFRQFLTVLEAAKWINLYFRKKFPLATPLMVSFFFYARKRFVLFRWIKLLQKVMTVGIPLMLYLDLHHFVLTNYVQFFALMY